MTSSMLEGILAGAFILLFMLTMFTPVVLSEIREGKEKETKAKFILEVLKLNPTLTSRDINSMWNGYTRN